MESNVDEVFNTLQTAFKEGMQKLPLVIGNEVVNFSKDSFKKQGWQGDVFTPWKKRKLVKGKGSTRAILVKTGRLRRSIRVTRANMDEVAIGTDVPYAKAHNEGVNGTVTVKAHSRKSFSKQKVSYTAKSGSQRMKTVSSLSGSTIVKQHTRKMKLPKRQFIGSSSALITRLKTAAVTHLSKYL